MYHRLGPMPMPMRLGILAFFLCVYGSMALPMCLGVPLVGGQTLRMVHDNAPSGDDRRIAEEIQARAAAQGLTLEVAATEIAQARRHGQLDELEEVVDMRFGPAPSAEPVHAKGAYYFDEVEEEEPGLDPLLLWAAAAFGAMFVALVAFGAALLSLVGRRGDDEHEHDNASSY